MTKAEALQQLTEMRDEHQRNYQTYDQQIEMVPTERALTLARYKLKISALQVAINTLGETIAS